MIAGQRGKIGLDSQTRRIVRPRSAGGRRIIIWTCRAGHVLAACEQWLINNHVPFDALNENLPERMMLHRSGDI